MLTVFIVLTIILATIVTIAIREDNKKNNIQTTELKKECGCGKTKNVDGYCDGSHMDA
jgi:CDGSH-type Zn-finger protein